MTTIPLFTFINYDRPKSFSEGVLSTLSYCVGLSKTQITVVKGDEVQIKNIKAPFYEIAFRVTSYILLFPLTLILTGSYLALKCRHNFTVIAPTIPQVLSNRKSSEAPTITTSPSTAVITAHTVKSVHERVISATSSEAPSGSLKQDEQISDAASISLNSLSLQEDLEKAESLKEINKMLLRVEILNDKAYKNAADFKAISTRLNTLFDNVPKTTRNHHKVDRLKTLLSQFTENIIKFDKNISETKESIKRFRDLFKEEPEIIKNPDFMLKQLINKEEQTLNISNELTKSTEEFCTIFETIGSS